jgi:hypothetical protein
MSTERTGLPSEGPAPSFPWMEIANVFVDFVSFLTQEVRVR